MKRDKEKKWQTTELPSFVQIVSDERQLVPPAGHLGIRYTTRPFGSGPGRTPWYSERPPQPPFRVVFVGRCPKCEVPTAGCKVCGGRSDDVILTAPVVVDPSHPRAIKGKTRLESAEEYERQVWRWTKQQRRAVRPARQVRDGRGPMTLAKAASDEVEALHAFWELIIAEAPSSEVARAIRSHGNRFAAGIKALRGLTAEMRQKFARNADSGSEDQ